MGKVITYIRRKLGDEGAEGKLRTKYELTPCNPPTTAPRWDRCDSPQAPLAALKLREGKNKWLTSRDHSPQDMSLQ